MRFLRTVSTRRLLAGLTGLIIAVAGGSAIAVAAAGNGPVPKKRSLASALHEAMSAKSVKGLTASITFTNNLLGSSTVQGNDPLLTGGQGRMWVGDGRVRLEVQSDNGDAQVVFNRGSFWAYDPAMNVVYKGKLPASSSKSAKASSSKGKADSVPSISQIQKALKHMAGQLGISRANPTDVGGRPAYRVAVSPKSNGGLLSDLKLAWDATKGLPLDFAVYAKGSSSPVLELKATGISYQRVHASVFNIKPPSGAKVMGVSLPKATSSPAKASKASASKKRAKEITGVAAVQKHVSFQLSAPSTLAGRARKSVSLVGGSGHHGAILFYGKGLGGIAVIERPASAGSSALPSSSSSGGDGPGLTIPTVSINGVRAEQLPTPLGTVLQFTRGGVSYVVLGSVTASTADAAARSL